MSQTAETFNKLVTLDVGGTIYRTTRDTLSASNYLVNLVDGKWNKGGKKEDEEAIFIDRDGFLFRYVLLYLRTGEVDIDKQHLKSLQNEAQFYLLSDLSSRIDGILSNDDAKGKASERVYQLLDSEEMVYLFNSIDISSSYGTIYDRKVKSSNYDLITTIKCNKNT